MTPRTPVEWKEESANSLYAKRQSLFVRVSFGSASAWYDIRNGGDHASGNIALKLRSRRDVLEIVAALVRTLAEHS